MDNTRKIIENGENNQEKGRKRHRKSGGEDEESSDDEWTQQNFNGGFIALKAAKIRYYNAQVFLLKKYLNIIFPFFKRNFCDLLT